MPRKVAPELATLVSTVPQGSDWLHEVKLDGYRTLSIISKHRVKMQTRNGQDWTEKYLPLVRELKKLRVQSAIFDGEIVVLDSNGKSSFSDLQEVLKNADRSTELLYYLFDLLYLNGKDFRDEPLEARKLILRAVLRSSELKNIHYNEHFRDQGGEIFAQCCKKGFEGFISKNRTKPYRMARSTDWLKIKCFHRQEFIIVGYTDPKGARSEFGALLLGVYEAQQLRYVGRVGTGFNLEKLKGLGARLEKLRTAESPVQAALPKKEKNIHWVKPSLVAEIEFKNWTKQNILRHASFVALRADKSAKEIIKEIVIKTSATAPFQITHPERVLYPTAQITKLDVASYYKSVAPWLLEHLARRPMSLLRCPINVTSGCFFQKHLTSPNMTAVDEDQIADQKFIFIDSEEGLLQLVQSGVLEFHTWQCLVTDPSKPNQVVFDLDPGENVPWSEVVKTAFRFKKLLAKLALQSFVKLTGGKGLHVHIPIAPRYTWDQVKAFAKTISHQLKTENPDLYTLNWTKKKRRGKIFLDYLRNGLGSTAITPYSLRAKERPFVALPLSWRELQTMKQLKRFDMKMTLARLASSQKDPWSKYNQLKQRVQLLES